MGDHVGASYPPTQAKMTSRCGDNPPVLSREQQEVAEQVEMKTYDVTNTCDNIGNCMGTCGIAGCTTETLELHQDDLFIVTKNNLDDSNMKTPYAEMDSVDIARSCCCFWSVNDTSPGCGCDRAEVEEIAAELQDRKLKRGNIAHLKQLRHMQGT